MVPYSGSIRPQILELRAGYARVKMKDRRFLRNHFRSLHAVALTNLGELTSGLAFTAGLPPHRDAIVTRLSTQFLKKARGPIIGESEIELVGSYENQTLETQATLRDAQNETVAIVTAEWTMRTK